jgi:ABC-type multidrug transport system ATPase subunit
MTWGDLSKGDKHGTHNADEGKAGGAHSPEENLEREQEALLETGLEVPRDTAPDFLPAPEAGNGARAELLEMKTPDLSDAEQTKGSKRRKVKKQKRSKSAKREQGGEQDSMESIVCLREVTSSEFEINEAGAMRPLIRNVSMEVFRRQVWGIGAGNEHEADTLCQIIGNMRPYYSGYCRIGPIGTMRDKRRILTHLFYIDTPNLFLPGMTVLEQLMFCTGKNRIYKDNVQRQKMLLELLVEAGLSHIALSRDRILLDTERLLLELIAAVFSESILIVCNFIPYSFSLKEIQSLRMINRVAREKNKALIIATAQPKLIGMTCDNVLFIRHGEVGYCGAVEELIHSTDNVFCVFTDPDASALAVRIEKILPGFRCEVNGEQICLKNVAGVCFRQSCFISDVSRIQPVSRASQINQGRVENSFLELMRQYDL